MAMSRIGFCPDTGHLAAGGGDAVALIRKHAQRVTHVHLKDFTPEPFGFHPLGHGIVDIPWVLEALRDAGYDHWATVELDEYAGRPGEAATDSFRYLQPLLAGVAS
jgi:inosose dehydratase